MKLRLLYISIISVLILSCNRESDFSGPELLPPSESFSFVDSLEVDNQSVDFITSSASFHASFSEEVSWELVLTGELSGAKKIFKGTDSLLTAEWKGRSDNVFLFRGGESVTAVLTFIGNEATDFVELEVDEPIEFEGILVADFEGNGVAPSNWWNAFKQNELIFTSDRFSDIPAPQGTRCLRMEGIDVGPDKFLGQTGHPGIVIYSDQGLEFPEDDDMVFFNFYASGTRGTRIEVRILETINGNLEGAEYSYFVNVAWTGWKLLSVPYSEFVRTGNDPEIPFQSAKKITRVKFVLRAVTGGNKVEANIDYPIFTVGKPFTP